jgi:hypothetical protein
LAKLQSQNNELEICTVCQEPTGNAGRDEDSLYCEEHETGPYCQKCFDNHSCMCQTQYMKRRAETINLMMKPFKGGD